MLARVTSLFSPKIFNLHGREIYKLAKTRLNSFTIALALGFEMVSLCKTWKAISDLAVIATLWCLIQWTDIERTLKMRGKCGGNMGKVGEKLDVLLDDLQTDQSISLNILPT